MAIAWDYYNKFDKVDGIYLPARGEGNTKATQIATAVNKLVYKWYNDGDVFDNTYHLTGWWNNLSSYANWLDNHVDKAKEILSKIESCYNEDDYEDLLKELADTLLDEAYLAEQNKLETIGTIYECEGRFVFEE